MSYFFALKAKLQVLKFEFVRVRWDRTMYILEIKWQNFAQVGVTQFAFTIQPFISNRSRWIFFDEATVYWTCIFAYI